MTYCFSAPKPPDRHDLQMPKVLPLPMMLVQRLAILVSSAALSVACVNGASVGVKSPVTAACKLVRQACKPAASGLGAAARFVQLVPLPPGPAKVESSFTTIELGRTPVSVFAMMSWSTERDTKPFGVTKQEQHEINCSSGEKA